MIRLTKKTSQRFVVIILIWFLFCCKQKDTSAPAAVPEKKPTAVSVGIPDDGGLSDAAATSIADIINSKGGPSHPLQMNVLSTALLPHQLINKVISGEMAFAVVESYELYKATRGKDEWKEAGPQLKAQAVLTLFTESVCLVAADDKMIRETHDLRGKRIFAGKPGSKDYRCARHALANAGIDMAKDVTLIDGEIEQATEMFEAMEIDALFYACVHPDAILKRIAPSRRPVRFISMPDVRRLLLKYPYYFQTTIPADQYPGIKCEVPVKTFGTKLALIASAKVPDKVVFQVTETVFKNVAPLLSSHPSFQILEKNDLTDGMFRMIHRGALQFYMENNYRLSCCF